MNYINAHFVVNTNKKTHAQSAESAKHLLQSVKGMCLKPRQTDPLSHLQLRVALHAHPFSCPILLSLICLWIMEEQNIVLRRD